MIYIRGASSFECRTMMPLIRFEAVRLRRQGETTHANRSCKTISSRRSPSRYYPSLPEVTRSRLVGRCNFSEALLFTRQEALILKSAPIQSPVSHRIVKLTCWPLDISEVFKVAA